jgi:hypothetical protein
MMTEGPRHDDDRPARAKRSLAYRIVWVMAILIVIAALVFVGLIVAIGLIQGDPGGEYFYIANRTDQTLTIVAVLDGGDKFVYATIRPHSSLTTGDDCGASEMIAKTSDGMEIARRGPFKLCNLNTWVIRDVSRSGAAEQSFAPIMGAFIGDPETPGYPNEWRVSSIRAAQTKVDFSLLVPEHSVANSTTMIAAFVLPGRAVALDFAAPAEPLKYIRQEYIEVYQATWHEEMSPLEAFKYDIENAPSPAKELTQIGGIPALTVEAHSAKDDEAANPAFVKFVLDGVEIQISGGEDLGMLIEIAESLITQAR